MKQSRAGNVDIRQVASHTSLSIGIPAYDEGNGILPTLESIWRGLRSLDLTGTQLIVSDSYHLPELSSVPSASEWARRTGALIECDSVERRRTLKEALNIILDRADTDVLILVNADVVVPTESLQAMLFYLLAPPTPDAAIGTILPDPAYSGRDRRAGAWQMRAVWRASQLSAPTVGPQSFRAEGAFWGVRRSFYSHFRFPLGSGSIHDDVELTRTLISGNYLCRNAAEAFVYKVPPGSLSDFCSATIRFRAAAPDQKRRRSEYTAALIEAVLDPRGALKYAVARAWCRRHRGHLENESGSEQWHVLDSTKRRRLG
jgi:hypothetical protein